MASKGRDCTTCDFFTEQKDETSRKIIGFCRRYPPVLYVLHDLRSHAYPKVWDGCWCGEYQPAVDQTMIEQLSEWTADT